VGLHRRILGRVDQHTDDDLLCCYPTIEQGSENTLTFPGADGVFQWFSAVFTILGDKARDIIVYNIPSVTMVPLSVSLIGRLRT
ncbi:dihydrodipicolinate synthase family protein, partial [Rhizobium johnstonii]